MNKLVKILLLITLVISAISAIPLMAEEKTTSYEVKNGTVIAVYNDQLVVKMANGETRGITVPAGFKFTVDGKQVGLDELKPGTELTAVIATTKTPQKVKTVQIKNSEVVKVAGNVVWLKQDGKYKSYTVPEGFNLFMDGKKIRVDELRAGQKLTTEIVYTAEQALTDREVQVYGKAPVPPS